ncbi:MAG TPA: hypothetical protein VKU38_22205 [Ktedonobacteraceae bacterium]|nr:hypothetical protein [Ktedonobacteraceae bacterium]
MQENKSIIAAFRQQQALEYEAAQRGLYGTAIVASHEFITARMERGAVRILQLIEEGKHAEALALINTETWGEDEGAEPSRKHTGTKQ